MIWCLKDHGKSSFIYVPDSSVVELCVVSVSEFVVVFVGFRVIKITNFTSYKNFQNYTVKIRSYATLAVLFHPWFSSRAGDVLRKTLEF